MNYAIETEQVSKHYGKVTAVDQLSLRVTPGEIYAFLGLNGAGKTTTIRMLLGMIKPTSGKVTVLGTPVHLGQSEPWADVGYLVETPHAYPELTVRENLEAARRLHPGTSSQAIGQIIERLKLGEYADRRSGTLSLGNVQRLGLAKALLHHPKLLLLDEPANSLDPAGVVEIRELLLDLTRRDGVTVFMSSHILGEVSRLAQRIGIIHQGRLLQEMNLEELSRNRKRSLHIRSVDMNLARQTLTTAGYSVEPSANGELVIQNGPVLDHPDEIATRLVQAACPPTHLVVEEEDLEDYFLRLVCMKKEE
jgi:ABC-2 type transport system ATP-binding protein